MKDIIVDTREPGAFTAQISEFEQSFQTSVIPEPGAHVLFAAGSFLVAVALRCRPDPPYGRPSPSSLGEVDTSYVIGRHAPA